MKHWSVAQKISLLFIVLLVLALSAVGVLGFFSVQQTMETAMDTTLKSQAELMNELIDELSFKALQVSTVVASLDDVREAYLLPDEEQGRAILREVVSPIAASLAEAAEIEQYRIHFHKPPAVSFYRTWTDQAGDDLSEFRKTILAVSESERALRTVELGRGGFVVRGIAPVLEGSRYLGSVEVYFPPGDIVPFLDSELRAGIVLLVNAEAARSLFFEEDLDEYFLAEIGDSLVSEVSDEWIRPEELIDPEILATVDSPEDFAVGRSGVYRIAYIPLVDYSGVVNGHLVSIVDAGIFSEVVRRHMIEILATVIVLSFAGGFLVLLFARSIVSRPLTVVTDNLKEIALGDGDLTVRLPESRKDEIGRLSRHFNNFVGNLHSIVSSITSVESSMHGNARELDASTRTTRDAADEIVSVVGRAGDQIKRQENSVTQASGSVEEITGNIKSLESMIVNLSTAIADSSAAVEEMTANIASITRNIEQVDDYVGRLESSSDHGRRTLKGVIERITDVVDQAENLKKANQLIATISAQTNLLAMNAAIEAAHAGEYGRGFAVVADEIRSLAENSTKQSRIISDELKSTHQAIENAVKASRDADTAFGSMQEMVRTVSDLERNVKESLAAQDEGNKAVLNNLDTMKSIGRNVNDGIGEISTGSNLILEEMMSLVESSRDLTAIIAEITRGGDAIREAMKEITAVSERNRELLDQISRETGRFRIE